MLAELGRGAADRAARARLAPVLGLGPWAWPDAGHAGHALAREIAGSTPPPVPVGAIPGLTVEGRCGFAWILHSDPTRQPSAELGRSARASWDAAALALPRSVPLLWSSVNAAHADEPRLQLVATLVEHGQAPRCSIVHGPSFGLAFFLLQASRVFHTPLPADLVASAAITDDGRIEPVEGLPVKIAAARASFPALRRVLVAASQVEDARACAAPLEVIGVASASQALEHVFGGRLVGLLLAEGADAQRRQELAEWFFRFALVGRGELVDWSPVASAAAEALARWPALSADQRFLLAFAQGIAERHEFNAGALPVPTEAWLRSRPAPLRLQLLAHLVQQAADVGSPAPGELAALLATFRQPDIHEGHPMAWRVEGAWARLLAVTGRPTEALERQRRLAHAYFGSLLYADVSFPLTEWFRLAGALGDRTALAAADDMRQRLLPLGAFGAQGRAYVELARARASLLLSSPPSEASLGVVRSLANQPAMAHHVRWAAARVLLRVVGRDAAEAEETLSALAEAAASPDRRVHHAARVATALIALDTALDHGGTSAAAAACDAMRALEPGLVGHLERAAASGERAAAVARFYPY